MSAGGTGGAQGGGECAELMKKIPTGAVLVGG